VYVCCAWLQVESSSVLSRAEREAAYHLVGMLEEALATDRDEEGEWLPCKFVEWHREKAFKHVALKCIAASIVATQPAEEMFSQRSALVMRMSQRSDEDTQRSKRSSISITSVDDLHIEGDPPPVTTFPDADTTLRVVELSQYYHELVAHPERERTSLSQSYGRRTSCTTLPSLAAASVSRSGHASCVGDEMSMQAPVPLSVHAMLSKQLAALGVTVVASRDQIAELGGVVSSELVVPKVVLLYPGVFQHSQLVRQCVPSPPPTLTLTQPST
jgi:hypothetical protein